MHIIAAGDSSTSLFDSQSRRLLVESTIEVSLQNGALSYFVLPEQRPYWKDYPEPTTADLSQLAEAFVAWEGTTAVGSVFLRRHWNNLVYIDDLVVSQFARRKGVALELLRHAKHWAQLHGHHGVIAETQNTNVPACLLYAKATFVLAGYDSMLYSGLPLVNHEVALFWYWTPHPASSEA